MIKKNGDSVIHYLSEVENDNEIKDIKESILSCEKNDFVEISKEHLSLVDSLKEFQKEFVSIEKLPSEKGKK